MLEFVDSGLYFVQDKNNFINPLLQVGSGSGSAEKSTGSGWPKINGSDRIRILIPAFYPSFFPLLPLNTPVVTSITSIAWTFPRSTAQ